MLRLLRLMILVVALGAAAAGAYLRWAYGGGRPAMDLTGEPLRADGDLSSILAVDRPIGDIAVAADGRIFFTVRAAVDDPAPRLFQWERGAITPFPPNAAQSELFVTPTGLATDAQDRLWVVDHGDHGFRGPRLYAFALATGEVLEAYRFPPEAAPRGSYVHALDASPDGRWVYLADASVLRRSPAIIVYDVERGFAHRALSGHPSLRPEPYRIDTPSRSMATLGGLAELRAGIAGLAVSADGTELTFGALNARALHRAQTRDLRAVPPTGAPAAPIEVRALGPKPLSHALALDATGDVFVGDVENGAVMRSGEGGALDTVVRSPRLRWPGGMDVGPDGSLYVADAALQDVLLRDAAHIRAAAPYHIYRVPLDVAAAAPAPPVVVTEERN